MYLKNILLIIFLIGSVQLASAQTVLKIVGISGVVMVRFGLEEEWKPASIGIQLKEIDTILTGENSETVIQLADGTIFNLRSNSVLDLGDLRKIYEKELFLFLMSQKVGQIESPQEKTPLRIGNVSVVHGASKVTADSTISQSPDSTWSVREINGAFSLYLQEFYSNAVVKFHKILQKYESFVDSGMIYFYIARSLEKLNLNGQAIDAYQFVVDSYKNDETKNGKSAEWIKESQKSIERLKKM
jgi:tetratricopeptide (TPR) repeat protein